MATRITVKILSNEIDSQSLGTIEQEWCEFSPNHLFRMYSSRRGDKHQKEDFLTSTIALMANAAMKKEILQWLKIDDIVNLDQVEIESVTQHRLSNNKIADIIFRFSIPGLEMRYIVVEAKIGNDFPTNRQLKQYHFNQDEQIEYRIVAQRRTLKKDVIPLDGRRWKCISWEDLARILSEKESPSSLDQSIIHILSRFGVGEYLTRDINFNFMDDFEPQVQAMVQVFDNVSTYISGCPTLGENLQKYSGREIRNQSRLIEKFSIKYTKDTHLLIGSFPNIGLCILVERLSDSSESDDIRQKMIEQIPELNKSVKSGSKWVTTPDEKWTAYYRLFENHENSNFDDLRQFFVESIDMIENFGGVLDILGRL